MTIEAVEFDDASEAMQYADAEGRHAIMINGTPLVVAQREADRLADAGIAFAYLCDHELPDGTFRIVSVPVN